MSSWPAGRGPRATRLRPDSGLSGRDRSARKGRGKKEKGDAALTEARRTALFLYGRVGAVTNVCGARAQAQTFGVAQEEIEARSQELAEVDGATQKEIADLNAMLGACACVYACAQRVPSPSCLLLAYCRPRLCCRF